MISGGLKVPFTSGRRSGQCIGKHIAVRGDLFRGGLLSFRVARDLDRNSKLGVGHYLTLTGDREHERLGLRESIAA